MMGGALILPHSHIHVYNILLNGKNTEGGRSQSGGENIPGSPLYITPDQSSSSQRDLILAKNRVFCFCD